MNTDQTQHQKLRRKLRRSRRRDAKKRAAGQPVISICRFPDLALFEIFKWIPHKATAVWGTGFAHQLDFHIRNTKTPVHPLFWWLANGIDPEGVMHVFEVIDPRAKRKRRKSRQMIIMKDFLWLMNQRIHPSIWKCDDVWKNVWDRVFIQIPSDDIFYSLVVKFPMRHNIKIRSDHLVRTAFNWSYQAAKARDVQEMIRARA